MDGYRDEEDVERCREMFDALSAGHVDDFLAACGEQLVLTVRGSDPLTTLVPRSAIPSWHASMHDLAGGSFRSEVHLVLAGEQATVVLVGHSLRREGVEYRYETVNRCLFRDGRLWSWFSAPVRTDEYAQAWGVEHRGDRLAARGGPRRRAVAAIP